MSNFRAIKSSGFNQCGLCDANLTNIRRREHGPILIGCILNNEAYFGDLTNARNVQKVSFHPYRPSHGNIINLCCRRNVTVVTRINLKAKKKYSCPCQCRDGTYGEHKSSVTHS